jgi:lysophospholipase L1-like esterase
VKDEAAADPNAIGRPAVTPMPFSRVLAVGDSVMQGAGPDLYASLPRALPGITVDALPSRQLWHAGAAITQHLRRGFSPEILLVHLGTNGLPSNEQIDEIFEAANGAHVVIVNTRAPRDWEDETNRRLSQAVRRQHDATLVDWWALTSRHPEWLKQDGFNLSRSGAEAYAQNVADAVRQAASRKPEQFTEAPTPSLHLERPAAVPPAVHPRESWTNRPPLTPLAAEHPLTLIVHHTAGSNTTTTHQVPAALRAMLDFHTSPEKGFSDIAYNFLIDRSGGVWEGRSGSINRPVVSDATGGNQGFAQSVCLLGNFSHELPTPDALSSLARTLAWLADRDHIDTSLGAIAQFTSRGSNLWPAGERVRVATIAGHRDLTRTECPGDALYDYVKHHLARAVNAARQQSRPA